MTVIELARFTVRPQDAEAMVARRPAMTAALQERVPGFLGLRLVRLGEDSWLDVVEWADQAALDAAQGIVMSIPECVAAFALIQEVVGMEQGEVRHTTALRTGTARA